MKESGRRGRGGEKGREDWRRTKKKREMLWCAWVHAGEEGSKTENFQNEAYVPEVNARGKRETNNYSHVRHSPHVRHVLHE